MLFFPVCSICLGCFLNLIKNLDRKVKSNPLIMFCLLFTEPMACDFSFVFNIAIVLQVFLNILEYFSLLLLGPSAMTTLV